MMIRMIRMIMIMMMVMIVVLRVSKCSPIFKLMVSGTVQRMLTGHGQGEIVSSTA